jgi:hypothetical protein
MTPMTFAAGGRAAMTLITLSDLLALKEYLIYGEKEKADARSNPCNY